MIELLPYIFINIVVILFFSTISTSISQLSHDNKYEKFNFKMVFLYNTILIFLISLIIWGIIYVIMT